MNEYFKRFLLKNTLISLLLLALGAFVFTNISPQYYDLKSVLIIPFAFIVNLVVFKIASKKSELFGSPTLLLTKSFALKFFAYLGITIFYLVIEPGKLFRITFVVILFCVYTVYTILEVTEITRVIKAENKPS